MKAQSTPGGPLKGPRREARKTPMRHASRVGRSRVHIKVDVHKVLVTPAADIATGVVAYATARRSAPFSW